MKNNFIIIDDDIRLGNAIKDFLIINDLSIPQNIKVFTFFKDFLKKFSKDNNNIYIVGNKSPEKMTGVDFCEFIHNEENQSKCFLLSGYVLTTQEKERMENLNGDYIKFFKKTEITDFLEYFTKNVPKIADNNNNNFQVIKQDIKVINNKILSYVQNKPIDIYNLNSREFEILIADLFSLEGYSVELTPNTYDGGKDIYAYKKNSFSENLLAIECKKYNPENKVGRPIIQKLYGVVEAERLTGGILVTSSFFTAPAKEFSQNLNYRIFLNDYYDVVNLLKKHNLETKNRNFN